MKKKSIVTFCLVVIVALLLNAVAFFGLPGTLHEKYGGMFDSKTGIRKGIDLAGGSVITFEAQYPNPSEEQMEAVKSVYETRLTQAGYTEARISIGEGGKVTIEVPSETAAKEAEQAKAQETAAPAAEATEAAETDQTTAETAAETTATATEAAPATDAAANKAATAATKSATSETDEIAALLSEVAKLTFRDTSGNVVLEGTGVASAKSQYGRPNNAANSQWYVTVNFTSEGADKFSAATAAAAAKASPNNRILIYMDETEVSGPSVRERIDSDSCVITGEFTQQQADKLASQINSGNLPFEMKKISQSTVSAELGADALPTSQLAAGIGILLIMIFMVWRYKLPGLVADLSLLIYIGLICLVMGVFSVNLSLSGIAGIVLSIGMAVDADCIIFERMKEELALGKSIRASVEAGFSKAFSAILDSNVTTIISCVVLYLSGIPTVIGFAVTLGIGVILSMFTAVVITKYLLRNLVNIGVQNRNMFYSAKKKVGGAENE